VDTVPHSVAPSGTQWQKLRSHSTNFTLLMGTALELLGHRNRDGHLSKHSRFATLGRTTRRMRDLALALTWATAVRSKPKITQLAPPGF